MEASREFSRTPPHLHPCSDVSVLQKMRMSHFWDTHHSVIYPHSEDNPPHLCVVHALLSDAGACDLTTRQGNTAVLSKTSHANSCTTLKKSAFTGSQRPICQSGATVGVRGF